MLEPADLIARFGSPLYVYRLDRVRAACDALRAVLPQPSRLYYSLKANPHPALCHVLRLAGCAAEVSSSGEVAVALKASYLGGDCLYTGPAKSSEEIAAAIHAGIRRFSIESLTDLDRVAAMALLNNSTIDCLLRVNTGAKAASSLQMSGSSQFGIPADLLLYERHRFIDRPGVRIIGAHLFSLSNARDEDALIQTIKSNIAIVAQLRSEGLPMKVVDLGGGFAAPHSHAGQRPHYPRLKATLESLLDSHLAGWREGDPAIEFESGRYLVGDCGSLVTTVHDIKHDNRATFVLLDSGIHHLGGMAGLGRVLRPAAIPISTGRRSGDARVERSDNVTVVGPLCTPADILARDVQLDRPSVGDVLVFPNVGAYGLTASLLAFLSRPTPAEIVLDNGRLVSVSRLALTRVPVDHSIAPCPTVQKRQ